MDNAKVGDVVYKGYSPASVGVVIKVETRAWDFEHLGRRDVPVLTVRKACGKTYEIPQGYCEDFRALIEDYRRKLARHEATLAKLAEVLAGPR